MVTGAPSWDCSYCCVGRQKVLPSHPPAIPFCSVPSALRHQRRESLWARQGLHPLSTCMEPAQLQALSLCQFLKANFSCAESKTPSDHKQAGAQPRPLWYKRNNWAPVHEILSAPVTDVDDFPRALLCSTQLHCRAPLNAALLKLLDMFENTVIQFGDSVWEALKFLAQV